MRRWRAPCGPAAGALAGVLLACLACGLPGNRIDNGGLAAAGAREASAVPVQNGNAYDPTSTAPTKPPCPPAAANELDVGTPCTADGGECDKLQAVFCTAAFTPLQPPYCTRSCETSADCGTGATCMSSPTNKATFWCVANGCVPEGYDTTAVGPGLAACLDPNGNSLGLGRPCSGGLTQCLNKGAQICTTSILKTAPLAMCTKLCKVDTDCGDAMTCGPAPGAHTIRVCLPNSCLP